MPPEVDRRWLSVFAVPQEVAMTNRIIVVLFLLTGLCALAQTAPSSSSQPLAPGATTGNCNMEPASTGDFWNGAEPNLANLLGHPLTTKKYVQGQVRPIQDCLNQLDGVADSNGKMIKDVDSRSQQGVQQASMRTKDAEQHAIDADNRAQAAQQAAAQTTAHLTSVERVVGGLDQYKSGAQTEIDFRPGQSVLSKKAKDALDAMAAPLKDQRSYILEVRGFSSGHGQAAIASSRQMANSVVRYLVYTHNIPAHRIYALGMGNVPATAEAGTKAKHTSGGRVEVSLLTNDLVSSAQH